MSQSLPVLCYHSVAPGERIAPALFEQHLDALTKTGLPSLCPDELDTAPHGFLVTFDDGFADVWTHVLPLLQRYNVKAVVFAIPARAGEGKPRLQGVRAAEMVASAVHGEASAQGGAHEGFLRWSEMQALEASGIVTIQSHSFAHEAGWVAEGIEGFHLGPASGSHWSLSQATGGDVRLGIPLYRRGSALAHRLYEDDARLRDHLAAWMEARGGSGYLSAKGAIVVGRELREELSRFVQERGMRGRWESDARRRARTESDLARAREVLETRLGGRRDELCLPWGEYDAVTLECARRVGIRRVYTLDRGPNPSGSVGPLIHRFEPRARGAAWLRSRVWIYRSTWRARWYGRLSTG